MSNKQIGVSITQGKKKVIISNGGFGLELSCCTNGHQSVGFLVDDGVLDMIVKCIAEYKEELKRCK